MCIPLLSVISIEMAVDARETDWKSDSVEKGKGPERNLRLME